MINETVKIGEMAYISNQDPKLVTLCIVIQLYYISIVIIKINIDVVRIYLSGMLFGVNNKMLDFVQLAG